LRTKTPGSGVGSVPLAGLSADSEELMAGEMDKYAKVIKFL